MENRLPTIIGLHSPAQQSGKSTVAAFIAQEYRGEVRSIAGGIRDVAICMGMPAAAHAQGDAKERPCEQLGGRTPRAVLISIGNAIRDIFGPDVWVRKLLGEVTRDYRPGDLVIIDDVRLPCEGEAILALGGKVVTITRSAAAGNHDEVNGFVPIVTVSNDGTVEECATAVWHAAFREGERRDG